MAEYIERVTVEGVRVTIYPDEPQDPRGDDNLGTIVDFGRYSQYKFGDVQYHSWEHFILKLAEDRDISDYRIGNKNLAECLLEVSPGMLYIPIYLNIYDGRLELYTEPSNTSVLAGCMYATIETIIKEYNKYDSYSVIKAGEIMKAELILYNLYLAGEAYGYNIEEVSICDCCQQEIVKDVDSTWGFFTIEDLIEDLVSCGYEPVANKLKEEI